MAYRRYRKKSRSQTYAQKVKAAKGIPWLENEQSRLIAGIQEHKNLAGECNKKLKAGNPFQPKINETQKRIEETQQAVQKSYLFKPSLIEKLVGSKANVVWKLKLAEQLKTLSELREKSVKMQRQHDEPQLFRQLQSEWEAVANQQKCLELVNERLRIEHAKKAREQAKKEKEQTKLKAIKEKEQTLRAVAARENKKSRKAAKTIKANLHKPDCCPYCGKEISGLPHADHIFPIAMGGLSVENNMVHVCADCNLVKSDKTLLEFCELTGLDFTQIVKALRELGKRV